MMFSFYVVGALLAFVAGGALWSRHRRALPAAPPPSDDVPVTLPSGAPAALPTPEITLAPRSLNDGPWSTGLSRARDGWQARFGAILGAKSLDVSLEAELEEALLTSDVGVATTTALIERIKRKLGKKALANGEAVRAALRDEATLLLALPGGGPLREASSGPTVIVMVGVNGVGKTTTIGKLTKHYTTAGARVLLGAGDTFRAAAADQLQIWGDRFEAPVVRGAEGADPSSVAFQAVTRAVAENFDVLLLDTAGRLHTKAPLMDEMSKVHRAVAKACPGGPHEVLLVLDATTGQNGLTQAKVFKEVVPLSGIVLTKLDGSAKGGIVLAIAEELGVPVRYVGLGEGESDLVPFEADKFVDALFGA